MSANAADPFITGYERMGAWADVLDRINVFPVADGDTGRNLLISLAPLRNLHSRGPQKTARDLLFAGRGNSGNIATQFVAELIAADSPDAFYPAAKAGRESAWNAVHDPCPGTMLTVLDRFTEALENLRNLQALKSHLEFVIDQMEHAVHETRETIPEIKAAGVVDAGALGMFLFLEGFLKGLCNRGDHFRAIEDVFADSLKISDAFDASAEKAFCVDLVVRMGKDADDQLQRIAETDKSAMVHTFQEYAKIHLHTPDVRALKQKAERMGSIVQWNEDDLFEQVKTFHRPAAESRIHIVTDAAGSLSRDLARRLGITLLESYITMGDTCMPETCVPPETLYRVMAGGGKVSTSQASVFERHQHYNRLIKQYENVLYLCVGSVYTGNYDVAVQWKKQHDPEGRFFVIDTGAASGRLAAAVIATAGFAVQAPQPAPEQVIEFAEKAVERSGEYIFLNELKYLAAGGRMSKTGAFFGDMLNMKPVITPTPRGAEKVGIVRNAEAQLRFAMETLGKNLREPSRALILLEYSDNRQWVEDRVMAEIKRRFRFSEILVQPLSLTSGAHIGPGAWAVAYCGESAEQ
ncbi:MAG: DegV family protein [Desulfosalsimonadaceae bacterium]